MLSPLNFFFFFLFFVLMLLFFYVIPIFNCDAFLYFFCCLFFCSNILFLFHIAARDDAIAQLELILKIESEGRKNEQDELVAQLRAGVLAGLKGQVRNPLCLFDCRHFTKLMDCMMLNTSYL